MKINILDQILRRGIVSKKEILAREIKNFLGAESTKEIPIPFGSERVWF